MGLKFYLIHKTLIIMAFSKATLFDKTDFTCSLLGKAIAHPARINILRFLLRNGQGTPSEIAKSIPLSQPAIACHFKFLRELNLVDFKEVFPNTYYEINSDLSTLHYSFIEFVCMQNTKDNVA